jgi:hypothetical protein
MIRNLILLSVLLISCNSKDVNLTENKPITNWNLQDRIIIFDESGYKVYRIWDKTSNSYVFVGTSNSHISIATR